MNIKNNYSLVLSSLEKRLIDARVDGICSYTRSDIKKSYDYTSQKPSIEIMNEDRAILMFDIIVFDEVFDYNIEKWQILSNNCFMLFLIVPIYMKQQIEKTCIKNGLSNYDVKPYRFVQTKLTRNVVIDI